MSHSIVTASALLGLSLIPLVSIIAIWRRRLRDADLGARVLPETFGEWMRIDSKGPQCGVWGDQPVFEWLRVELADGTLCDLSPEKPFSVPPGFRPVRLDAGRVTYWGFAPDDRDTRAPNHGATDVLRKTKSNGFSLLELMIVVAMIGILTAIALPIYRAYVQQSAAKPAQTALLELAQQLDSYAQDHNTYVGGCATVPTVQNAQLSCLSTSSTDYTIAAQGTGPISGLTYTLTKAGLRATPSAPPGWATSAVCWVIDAQGDCA